MKIITSHKSRRRRRGGSKSGSNIVFSSPNKYDTRKYREGHILFGLKHGSEEVSDKSKRNENIKKILNENIKKKILHQKSSASEAKRLKEENASIVAKQMIEIEKYIEKTNSRIKFLEENTTKIIHKKTHSTRISKNNKEEEYIKYIESLELFKEKLEKSKETTEPLKLEEFEEKYNKLLGREDIKKLINTLYAIKNSDMMQWSDEINLIWKKMQMYQHFHTIDSLSKYENSVLNGWVRGFNYREHVCLICMNEEDFKTILNITTEPSKSKTRKQTSKL